jgi:hypothetical protein
VHAGALGVLVHRLWRHVRPDIHRGGLWRRRAGVVEQEDRLNLQPLTVGGPPSDRPSVVNRNRHDVADTMLTHALGTSPSRPSRRDALVAESAPRPALRVKALCGPGAQPSIDRIIRRLAARQSMSRLGDVCVPRAILRGPASPPRPQRWCRRARQRVRGATAWEGASG